jgi:serine/threonine protein kinase
MAENEIEKLVKLEGKHHIINLKDHFVMQSCDLYCLVLPYYPGGEIPKSDDEIRSFMFQLLQARPTLEVIMNPRHWNIVMRKILFTEM